MVFGSPPVVVFTAPSDGPGIPPFTGICSCYRLPPRALPPKNEIPSTVKKLPSHLLPRQTELPSDLCLTVYRQIHTGNYCRYRRESTATIGYQKSNATTGYRPKRTVSSLLYWVPRDMWRMFFYILYFVVRRFHWLCRRLFFLAVDQGYGRGGTPTFTGVFEPVARVTLYLTEENGLGSCFGAA